MAGSLNKVMLIGNLGADHDMRQTQDGKKMALLSLATSESWKDRGTGEKKEKTDWHRIVIFNEGLAGIVENYLKKGSKIFVEGQLRTRKYTDANGVEKFTTEVVLSGFNGNMTMLDSRSGGADSNFSSETGMNQDMQSSAPDDIDIDDEIIKGSLLTQNGEVLQTFM